MIYFLQPVSGGPIKIGFTDQDVEVRRKQLEAVYGQPLSVLGTMLGGRQVETDMHERFAHLRLGRTEQFRPAADLMAFIGRPLLVDPNPDTVEAMSPRRKGTKIRVSEEFAEAIAKAAFMRNMKVEEFLDTILLQVIEEDYRDAVLSEAQRIGDEERG